MLTADRIKMLRGRLIPPGTPLADVPPDHRGLTEAEARELVRLEEQEALSAQRSAMPPVEPQPVATKRDGYGWRSAPGRRFLPLG